MYIFVVCEKILKQITIEILININLSYTNCGYRVATISRPLLKCGYRGATRGYQY